MAIIAIVGGGFCGAEVAKHLKGHDVIVFDKKDYFEYTPSVHKLLTDTGYEKKIRIPYSKFLRACVVKDDIRSVTGNAVITEHNSYGFDYLVLCAGSSTSKPENAHILKTGEDAKAIGAAMENAREITIIGGGFTGVEIAGELATKTNKTVRLLNGSVRLMDRTNREVGEKAADFLHRKGVRIIFNKTATERDLTGLAIWCIGINPNTSTMAFPKDSRGFVLVEETLQVKGFANVFAGGDINDVKEEKSAQNAEIHGQLIARNIKLLMKGEEPEKYSTKTRAMLVSLGDKYAIFCYGDRVFDGLIPAVMKKFVEKWTVFRFRFL